MYKLIRTLQKIVIVADFKTVTKKFIGLGIDKDLVDSYIEDFKSLKNKNRIKKTEDKNIDNWGKKPWEDFVEFVDTLKKEKSKTEEKKLKKMEGAELKAEDDNWLVYKITTHDAAKIYGAGTKWCITQESSSWWNKYIRRNEFYFLLSKTLDEKDPFYKIAMQCGRRGKIFYWDATDKRHDSLPGSLEMIKFKPDKFKVIEDPVALVIADIEDYITAQEEYYNDPEGDYASYLYEEEINLEDNTYASIQDDLEILKQLCEKLELDFEKIVKDDTTTANYITTSYNQTNEIARFYVGNHEYEELPEDLKEAINALTEDEQQELKQSGPDNGYLSDNFNTVSFGDTDGCFVLIIDEDKLQEKIEEFQENEKVLKEKNTSAIDKMVLNGKNSSTRIRAIQRSKNQAVIEKAYRDKVISVRVAAAAKIKNPELLDKIILNPKEDRTVRVAAISNKNFKNQDTLKKIVEKYRRSENDDWTVYTTAFEHIKDMKWLNKYVLQPKISPSIRETLVEKLSTKMAGTKTEAYIKYLKKLADLMIKEDQISSLGCIIDELPASDEEFFKKIALMRLTTEYHNYKDSHIKAIERITDEKFLKDFITTNITKNVRHNTIIEAAFTNIKDQSFLKKCLKDEKFHAYFDIIEVILREHDYR